MYTSRDVVVADLGDTFGHAQNGRRPCIVVSAVQGMVLLIPCTSNMSAARFDATVTVEQSIENGLDVDSVALVFQLRALDVRRVERKLGVLGVGDIAKVNEILNLVCRL